MALDTNYFRSNSLEISYDSRNEYRYNFLDQLLLYLQNIIWFNVEFSRHNQIQITSCLTLSTNQTPCYRLGGQCKSHSKSQCFQTYAGTHLWHCKHGFQYMYITQWILTGMEIIARVLMNELESTSSAEGMLESCHLTYSRLMSSLTVVPSAYAQASEECVKCKGIASLSIQKRDANKLTLSTAWIRCYCCVTSNINTTLARKRGLIDAVSKNFLQNV